MVSAADPHGRNLGFLGRITLSLGNINTGAWSSRLGLERKINDLPMAN
jgi:hypothetical protein